MVNWYYVVSSDRVGPVSAQALRVLFLNGEINTNTYVWKKGFVNWERLGNVDELNFEAQFSSRVSEQEGVQDKISFDWSTVRKNEELFFIQTGKDRRRSLVDLYGPYSIVELKEALIEKRINLHTLIYSPGMDGWIKVQDTPLNNDYIGISLSASLELEPPLLLVFDSSPNKLVTLVKNAGVKDVVLLGGGYFADLKHKTVKASLYVGRELKVKNIQVRVQKYEKKDQTVECHFIDLNSDAKKIMLNYAI